MDGSQISFALLRAEVLLLAGQKSPAFLHDALDALQETLPHIEHMEYAGPGHDRPDETAPVLLTGIACPVLFLPPLARQFRTSRSKLVREPSEVAEVALEGALDMDTTG